MFTHNALTGFSVCRQTDLLYILAQVFTGIYHHNVLWQCQFSAVIRNIMAMVAVHCCHTYFQTHVHVHAISCPQQSITTHTIPLLYSPLYICFLLGLRQLCSNFHGLCYAALLKKCNNYAQEYVDYAQQFSDYAHISACVFITQLHISVRYFELAEP